MTNNSHRPVKPSSILYDHFFEYLHPVGSVQTRFEMAFRRWSKPHLLNNCRISRLGAMAIANLQWLSRHVPPRIHMAVIRLHLNAWHTDRRYQRSAGSHCVFCSNQAAEDSIEHLFFCPVVQSVFPAHLKKGRPPRVHVGNLLLFQLGKKDKVMIALVWHAIYTTHNMYRHTPDRGEFKKTICKIISEAGLTPPLHSIQNELIQSLQWGRFPFKLHVACHDVQGATSRAP